jgi:hypothetical protein
MTLKDIFNNTHIFILEKSADFVVYNDTNYIILSHYLADWQQFKRSNRQKHVIEKTNDNEVLTHQRIMPLATVGSFASTYMEFGTLATQCLPSA